MDMFFQHLNIKLNADEQLVTALFLIDELSLGNIKTYITAITYIAVA